jgi:hypothetical protein
MASQTRHAPGFTPVLKQGGLALGLLLLAMLVAGMAAGLYQTHKAERDPHNAKFRDGSLPRPLPNGFFPGTTPSGPQESWQGKVFDRQKQTGINRFKDGQKYVFKTSPAPGLRDKNTQVLRLDYKQAGNPFWLRFIVDEIVEIAPGHYLGKVHLKVIPGLTFTLSYFELSAKME